MKEENLRNLLTPKGKVSIENGNEFVFKCANETGSSYIRFKTDGNRVIVIAGCNERLNAFEAEVSTSEQVEGILNDFINGDMGNSYNYDDRHYFNRSK